MDLAFQMTQEQSQKLVMTTQMREALSVLEMSAADLVEYVTDCAERNVFLDYHPLHKTRAARTGRPSDSRPTVENAMAVDWSLVDEITQQLRLMNCDRHERSWAIRLAHDLDENGYLGCYHPDLVTRLGLSEPQWAAAVALIQKCEPAGVGARDLRECLLLQMDQIDVSARPLVRAIVERHLEDIAEGRMVHIARQLKVDVEDVYQGLQAIRTLNPRPGGGFSTRQTHYVRPDLTLVQTDSGYAVVVTDTLSEVTWDNGSYRRMLQDASLDVRHYLTEQWREASWIRRCIEQRALTLRKIGEAILYLQMEFPEGGFERLRPMRLRDVADVIGIHESTVSRAIRHKTIETPKGLVELKQLFSTSLHSAMGDVSAGAIKHQIREWIQAEQAESPLTDAVIAARLQESGVQVSRRTVAKYREAMGIPGSALRRIRVRLG